LDLLGEATVAHVSEPTAALGNWYANVVPTVAGELVVFANEFTLLSVAVPVGMIDRLVPCFEERVYKLLRMIGVPGDVARQELAEMPPMEFARTASRSVVGSLNEIGLHYQLIAEQAAESGKPNLSAIERYLSRLLHGPLDYVYPVEIATRILSDRYGHSLGKIERD
jgi:hypothetical protein